MSTNTALSNHEQEMVRKADNMMKMCSGVKERCSRYKIGDVYLMECDDKRIEKNSIGEPLKFQIDYISPEGIPFYRQLSAKGISTGALNPVPEAAFLAYANTIFQPNWQFVQDPEQLDAMMLQQEYEPMKQHNEKLHLKVEIDKHNKSITVPTGWYCEDTYMGFLKSLQPGDKFWTSPDKQFVVHTPANKGSKWWTITVIDQDQKQIKLKLADLAHKRLYKDRPRSFAREVKK